MENLEGKVMTPELTDRTHSLKRPFRCLDFMIYRYFREPNDLGVWKMRNMMTVTIKMTERLHSFLCWLARLRADSDLKHLIRNVILAQAHYFSIHYSYISIQRTVASDNDKKDPYYCLLWALLEK